MYDVIIVGAGPGGSMAAKEAAKAGLNTLLLDRRKELGAPVRCGEGIGLHWIDELGIKVNQKWVSAEINGAFLAGPSGKGITLRTEESRGFVIDRKVFDKELAIEAGRAGAEIISKAEVVDLIKENGKIAGVVVNESGNKREMKSKVVIAADGGESTVGRMAGINTVATLYDTDFGFEYEMVGVECSDLIEIYIGKTMSPRGYLWIFPKGKDVANVGVGIGGLEQGPAKKYLDAFIEKHPERFKKSAVVAIKGGVIPVGAPLQQLVLDNFMIIGTAAHMVDPIHGGGMCLAAESGILAGKAAVEAISKGDTSRAFLKKMYEDEWRKREEGKLLKRLKLRKAMEKLNDDDYNVIFETLTPADVDLLLQGNFVPVVKKILLKRPQLLKALQALL